MTDSDDALTAAIAQIERAQADRAKRPTIAGFFDEATNTVTYVVSDPATKKTAVVDSVLDYEAASGRTSFGSADRVIEYVEENGLSVEWHIETHAHADHLSAAPYLQEKLGGKLAIGAEIVRVQDVFGKLFNAGTDFERDGSQFDRLFGDGETFSIGELEGIAHRCDFDLKQHQEHSGTKLEYMDPTDTSIRFIPHVIEPAAGLSRGVLALICEAYTEDPDRPSGMYMKFHPALAPKKAAILPLTAKPEHAEPATKLYLELREEFPIDLDIKQNIGKRYARQDEIGTPYCFTIDNDTLEDGTVTVRDRDTMAQERISMDKVAEYLREKMKA